MATVGALVGWKFRAALVLGHVKRVEGDTLSITPVSKPESEVRRKREKVLTEAELDPADVVEAMKRHGHMARTATKSRSAKAQKIGLGTPSQARAAARRCASRRVASRAEGARRAQMMPEGEARAAKRSRSGEYKKEAAARKAPQARGKGKVKAASPEEAEEEEEAPPTPTPTKSRSGGAKATPAHGKKATAKAA